MPETITFILPALFEARFNSLVEQVASANTSKANLSKAKKRPSMALQGWLSEQYNLPESYHNSASFMAIGHGLTEALTTEKHYWLRADPIMLTVGHNGLFCRGNRVLNVTDDERQSLQELINPHFAEDKLTFILFDSSKGYLKTPTEPTTTFTPLKKLIGSEISNALPSGDNAPFWHGVLTDIQMLLHNCEVNQRRKERGEPEISGLWLWAESELSAKGTDNYSDTDCKLYTDDAALSGVLGKAVNLNEIGTHFDCLQSNNKHIRIYSTELQDASSQDDQHGWLALYQYWFENWIQPAIKAVNKKNCQQLELITDDGFCYRYNTLSRWCFWR